MALAPVGSSPHLQSLLSQASADGEETNALQSDSGAAAQAEQESQGEDIFLRGRVVTMDELGTVKDGGVLISDGKIKSIEDKNYVPPPDVKVVETNGDIYPGMINLHNHTAYNFLPPYEVKQSYGNRDQWPSGRLYETHVNNPKNLITSPGLYGKQSEVLKYAEIMQVVGGATAVQGTPSDGAISRTLARNVELPNPEIHAKDKVGQSVIGVDKNTKPEDAQALREAWSALDAFFYHLSEGRDEHALEDYYTLKKLGLIVPSFVGIHSAALGEREFEDWRRTTGQPPKIVWSPLSNLLLYGQTTDILAALKHGAKVALGTDWTPSGSKNMLWELKVADQYNRQKLGGALTARQLVEMVTTKPAEILNWDEKVGQIKPGMVADIPVLDRQEGDPYRNMIEATERNVKLVCVGGDPVYGDKAVMESLEGDEPLEEINALPGRPKALDIHEPQVPKGTQTLEEIENAIVVAGQFDPADLADKLNAGSGFGPEKFKARTAVKTWLTGRYIEDGTPVPPSFSNPNAPITTAQVQDYLKRKFPNAKPLPGITPLFQETDKPFFTALQNNLHMKGPNRVLNIEPLKDYLAPTANA